jgi:hypothetical protein
LSWDFDDDFEENPDDFIDEEELIEGFEHAADLLSRSILFIKTFSKSILSLLLAVK